MDEAEAVGEPSGDATAVLGAESAVMVRLAEALLVGRAVVLILAVEPIGELCGGEKEGESVEASLGRLSRRVGEVDLVRSCAWWEEWLGIPTMVSGSLAVGTRCSQQ